jgi:hypothetical protein
MAGLVPAIHAFVTSITKDVDARHKAGHDESVLNAATTGTQLLFAHHDIGRVGMFHPDDVVAGIDMMDLAGHATREI